MCTLGILVYVELVCRIFIWVITPPNKWNQPQFERSYMQIAKWYCNYWPNIQYFAVKWRLVHIACTFSLSSSTAWNSVLPHRTQKRYSFSAGLPAMQVHLHVCHLPGTLYAHLVHLLPQNHVLKAHSNMWA